MRSIPSDGVSRPAKVRRARNRKRSLSSFANAVYIVVSLHLCSGASSFAECSWSVIVTPATSLEGQRDAKVTGCSLLIRYFRRSHPSLGGRIGIGKSSHLVIGLRSGPRHGSTKRQAALRRLSLPTLTGLQRLRRAGCPSPPPNRRPGRRICSRPAERYARGQPRPF